MRETADERRAVQPLELVELAAVDEPCNDFVHVVGRAAVGWDNGIDVLRWIARRLGLTQFDRRSFYFVETCDQAACNTQRMSIILCIVVGDPGCATMHIGAAQFLGGHNFAGRGFHEGRPREEDRALVSYDDRLVGHSRRIGAAGRAGAHHDGDLRNALRGHLGLVVEDVAEMIPARKHLVLIGQVGAAAVDQIDTGQSILQCDFLGSQMLLYGHGKISASFDRRIIGDDHAFASGDTADAGDQSRRGRLAVIETMRCELADLEEKRNRIDQCAGAITGQQFSPRQMSRAPPALRRGGLDRPSRSSPRRASALPRHSRRLRGNQGQSRIRSSACGLPLEFPGGVLALGPILRELRGSRRPRREWGETRAAKLAWQRLRLACQPERPSADFIALRSSSKGLSGSAALLHAIRRSGRTSRQPRSETSRIFVHSPRGSSNSCLRPTRLT